MAEVTKEEQSLLLWVEEHADQLMTSLRQTRDFWAEASASSESTPMRDLARSQAESWRKIHEAFVIRYERVG